MASLNVDVKPEIINWVLRKIQSENIAGPAVELLYKWQAGEKTPTFNQVEDMSKKVNIPFGYFFLDKPPKEECPIVEYRTVDSASILEPSRNLIDTVDWMTDIQEWMVEYAVENGQEELEYVGSAANVADLRSVTEDIRSRLGIETDWFADMKSTGDAFRFIKKKMENIHVLVMMNGVVRNNNRRKLNVKEFRAFTLVNKYVPLIFINTCDSETGKLFSIFHELAHIWVGENSFYNAQMGLYPAEQGVEKFCNAVAAELLVPTEIFLKKWEDSNGNFIEEIERMAKIFRCSRFVIARKALDCGKISLRAYEQAVEGLTRRFDEWLDRQKDGKESGGDYYRTLVSKIDRNFIVALARSAEEGRTQYTEVYRLTNTNRTTFGKLLDEVGGID